MVNNTENNDGGSITESEFKVIEISNGFDRVEVTAAGGTLKLSHGMITVMPDGSFSYTPDKNRSVKDSFRYVIFDGEWLEEGVQDVRYVRPMIDPFAIVQERINENRAHQTQLRCEVASRIGLEPDDVRKVQDWGDRYHAVLPQGARFVSKRS